jgi:hypothetical protein
LLLAEAVVDMVVLVGNHWDILPSQRTSHLKPIQHFSPIKLENFRKKKLFTWLAFFAEN